MARNDYFVFFFKLLFEIKTTDSSIIYYDYYTLKGCHCHAKCNKMVRDCNYVFMCKAVCAYSYTY